MKAYLKPDAEFIAFESENVTTQLPDGEIGVVSGGNEGGSDLPDDGDE